MCGRRMERFQNFDIKMFRACRDPIKVRPRLNKEAIIVTSKHDYKGCEYMVGFKVNREVSLMGLEFFGPFEKDHVDYKVRMRVCRTEEEWSPIRQLLSCFGTFSKPIFTTFNLLPSVTTTVRDCRVGERFTVAFPNPVHISPDVWTDIKFELIGPPTMCLKYGFSGDEIPWENASNVKFDFLAGSHQLPAILFTTGYIAY